MRPLRVRILGPLEVEGIPPAQLGNRKARALLTLLVAAGGRPVGVDTAIDVVWGEAPPSAPKDQLSVLVSRLRRAVGTDRVVRSDAGYAVRADWADVGELEALVAEATARLAAGATSQAAIAAHAALALERGPLAADEQAVWFDEPRRIVERTLLRARSVLAESALGEGDYRTAAAAAEVLLDADPYDEAAVATLMLAHGRAGRPSSALGAYARLRRRLIDDLGVDPSAALQELHRSFLEVDGPAPVEPRRVDLAGREAELARLVEALDELSSGAAAVVVSGAPGSGKTTLLRMFGERARQLGALVLSGRCDPLGRHLPLQPVIEAVLRTLPPDHAELGPLADVADRIAGEADGSGKVTTLAFDGRDALHQDLLELVEALGADRSVVIAIDDVDDADEATLDWLRRAITVGRRILVAVTAGSPIELPSARTVALQPPGSRVSVALDDDTTTVMTTAAVLGPRLDLDLLAVVLQRSALEVLDAMDVAARAEVVMERAGEMIFRREAVRTSLAASILAPRRRILHRAAAEAMAARPMADPLELAWHAEQGGVPELAVDALRRAAGTAQQRFELDRAVELLDRALDLVDDADSRVARARVHLAARRLDAAKADTDRALELRADAGTLELAGWVAYHRREHDLARAFADEGVARAADAELRASLLALAGRHRHMRGEIADGERCLEEALELGTGPRRALALVWLAQVRAHSGRPAEATQLAARGLVDLSRSDYPFAIPHALFIRTMSLGHAGRVEEALTSLDDLDREVEREGVQARRFGPMAWNLRGWLLRQLGRIDEADELNRAAAAVPRDVEYAEPRYAALLDLVDGRLLLGDVDGARALVGDLTAIETWQGSMAWRHRLRYRLALARLAEAEGDVEAATHLAVGVRRDAEAHVARRYVAFAELAAQRVGPADRPGVDALLDELDDIAAPEAWWLTAQAAAATGRQRWWDDAQRRVEFLATRAGPAGDRLRTFAADCFRRWR